MLEKIKKITLSNIVLFSLVFVFIYADFNMRRWDEKNVIKWDIVSYYSYLPAYFIHDDITLSFTKGKEGSYIQKFWPEKAENGGRVIKTTMGMSILYAPFFAIAHWSAKILGYEADGFSEIYHMFIHLSSAFYMFLGLFFLFKFLKRYFSEFVTTITIIILVLGTNVYYYTTMEAAMSHSYNFSLISILLYFFDSWFKESTLKNTLFVGLLFGLLVLIRPINILLGIIPLFYHVNSFSSFLNNLKMFFTEKLKWSLLIVLCALCVVFPQLLYWKYITGMWFFNSYVGESFFFNSPHIIDGLFSFRKGWLIYTPIMSFAFIGMYFLYKKQKNMFIGPLILTVVYLYIVFSWWCWWYGGSYGMRALIDIYPILAMPIAALILVIQNNSNMLFKYVFYIFTFLLISLNLFQSLQAKKGVIHHDSMTKETYFAIWGWEKSYKPHGYWETLKKPDYEKAKKGLD